MKCPPSWLDCNDFDFGGPDFDPKSPEDVKSPSPVYEGWTSADLPNAGWWTPDEPTSNIDDKLSFEGFTLTSKQSTQDTYWSRMGKVIKPRMMLDLSAWDIIYGRLYFLFRFCHNSITNQ